MATLANIVQTYTQKGQAEDFENAIYSVTPWETPLLTAFGRGKADGKLHKWQIDVLNAPAANAQLEGDDAPALGSITATVEVGNYTQISRKVVGVSGTMEVVTKYGRTSEMAYQMAKAAKELKSDIDFTISQNSASVAGATGTARQSAGVESWIASNTYVSASVTTGSTTGYTTSTGLVAAPTDGTAQGSFDESVLKALITQIWSAATGQVDMIVMAGARKAAMSTSTFAGIATRFRDVGAGQKAQIISGVDLYVSDFGTHKLVPSRNVRSKTVLALNTDYWSVNYLRPFFTKDLAVTGDHMRKMMIAEWCLVSKNEKASGKLRDLG